MLWPPKDPDEVLDYKLDWSRALDGDTITGSTWIITGGGTLTQNTASFNTTTTTIWLQGGTLGSLASLLNRVTTAGGRTMDETVSIRISNK